MVDMSGFESADVKDFLMAAKMVGKSVLCSVASMANRWVEPMVASMAAWMVVMLALWWVAKKAVD